MKTNDEYLVEYVREKRPEIEGSYNYFFWKLGRQLCDVVHGIAETLNSMSMDELNELLLACAEDSEEDQKEVKNEWRNDIRGS